MRMIAFSDQDAPTSVAKLPDFFEQNGLIYIVVHQSSTPPDRLAYEHDNYIIAFDEVFATSSIERRPSAGSRSEMRPVVCKRVNQFRCRLPGFQRVTNCSKLE